MSGKEVMGENIDIGSMSSKRRINGHSRRSSLGGPIWHGGKNSRSKRQTGSQKQTTDTPIVPRVTQHPRSFRAENILAPFASLMVELRVTRGLSGGLNLVETPRNALSSIIYLRTTGSVSVRGSYILIPPTR